MPDIERKSLAGHQPRGVSGGSGCAAAFFIAFGLPFMGAGTLLGLVAHGVIPQGQGTSPPPEWLIPCLALVFFGAGAFVTLKLGVGTLMARFRARARRAQYPHEPWRADHPWDPAGATHAPGSSLLGQLAAMAFMATFLAPFNYFTFYAPPADMPTWARVLVGFFDLILVLMVVGIVMTLVQQARYGRARLAFRSFPYFLGDTLAARLATSRAIGEYKKLTFTLRCIEERTETTRSGNKTTIRTVCDQLWADERSLEGGALREGNEVPVSFDLPVGEYGTRLAEAPARYWELAVSADTRGLDFAATFLVPVYARR